MRYSVAVDQSDPVAQIRAAVPDGLDRIVEVDLSANAGLDAEVVHQGTLIAAYNSSDDRPRIPFWPLLFTNVTIELLGSDDFPAEAKHRAARDLSAVAAEGRLTIPVAPPYSLDRIAEAHEDARRRPQSEAGHADGSVALPARRPLHLRGTH